MKKREKGFMLVETLVVSTLVSTVLIALYVQFNNIVNNFNRDFDYNSIGNLYATQTIKKFILKDADGNFYKNLKTELEKKISDDKFYFLEIAPACDGVDEYLYSIPNCNIFSELTSFYQVKKIIFTRESAELKETDYPLLDSQNFVTFINSIRNDPAPMFDDEFKQIYNYRIIIEFENNEYATLIIAN
ncbi:MAG: prepilin-type N-terminal cleavage/methylation domain-containing protein [Bacilli bacterium]|nr:prepilin-type N-terminal cleavage/methylation domain-containing protein [Bacilli bacterium]MCI9433988.1 prepilin-type N-terminal cleavage/methylation domain-containing protein [Bacilli bacterium]